MPYASYADRLARTRAYNRTPAGRAVKRAARLRQLQRERAGRQQLSIDPKPLASVVSMWGK